MWYVKWISIGLLLGFVSMVLVGKISILCQSSDLDNIVGLCGIVLFR
jgi:hypothetical protein